MGLETQLETKIKKYCDEKNFLCWKLSSPSTRGVPDRIVLAPNGRILFLELKAPRKKATDMQEYRLKQLQDRGFDAVCTDNFALAKELIDEMEV